MKVIDPAGLRAELRTLHRRGLIRHGLSLGSLALLTGCDLGTHTGVNAALWAMLRFNDRIQAALFNPSRLAETYPASAITHPFRFNAFYEDWQVRPGSDGMAARRRRSGEPIEHRGAWRNSAPCRNRARSPGTSASRVGAKSANGAAFPSVISYAGRGRICGAATSRFAASTATRPASTWRARCNPRPFWPWTSSASR